MEEIPKGVIADPSLVKVTALVYALQTAGLIIGVSFFAAIIINYIKKDDLRGTWLESHCRWQMRTFWFGLLWGAVGVLTYLFFIGYFILIAASIWTVYRIAKGWLFLSEGKVLYR